MVPDDEMTIVVGTRFVSSFKEDASPKSQFANSRIPLSMFNNTDHCIDQKALESAKSYFETLGRGLGKAGYFYVLPDDVVRNSASECEKLHQNPPHAWVNETIKIVAYGQAVPTVHAAALEESIR